MLLVVTFTPALKAYIALVVGVWLATAGVPIPEEITLLTAGVLAGMGVIDVRWAIALGILACFSGDCAVFSLARRMGRELDRHPWLRRILRGRFARKARYLYVHRGPWALFIARLLPGVKMPFVFTAGAFRMPWRKFLFYDLSSVTVLVPSLIMIAYWTSPSVTKLTGVVRNAGAVGFTLLIIAVLVAAWLIRRAAKRRDTPSVSG